MAKRGRPLVADESTLLHPRKVWNRKNVLKGSIIATKPPSKALIRLYGHIIDEAISLVLTQPSRANNVSKKNKIEVTFPKNHKYPDGWPIGRIVKELDGMVTRAYTCEMIVLWGYQWMYCKWQPSDLYKMRAGVMHGLAKLERELDISYLETIIEDDSTKVVDKTEEQEDNDCIETNEEVS